MRKVFFLLSVLITLALPTLAQKYDTTQVIPLSQTDTTKPANTKMWDTDNDDSFSPGLFFILLFAICAILLLVGAGIVITAVCVIIIAALVGAGILSASILVGLNKRSVLKGLKVFLVLSGGTAGFATGVVALFIISRISHAGIKASLMMLYGGGCGLIAGVITGLVVFIAIKRLIPIAKQWFNIE